MELGRRALTGIGWGAIGAIAGGLLQLLQLAWLARLLAPEDYGLAAMAAIPMGLAAVFADAGIGNVLVVRQDLSRAEQSSLYWLNWGASLLMALAILLAAPATALAFAEPRLAEVVAWTALSFALTPLGQQFQFLLQKELNFRAIALVEILAQLCAVATSILWARAGHGALSLIWGGIVGSALRSLGWALLGWRRWPPQWHFAWDDVRRHLGFGAYQLGERLLNFAAWNLDKLLISALLGARALGYYNMAYQLVQRPLAILQPIVNRVALPVFSRVGDSHRQLNRGYLLVVQALALAFFPLFGAVALLSGDVVELMLGPGWQPAAEILVWLALLHAWYAIGPAIGPYLLALRRADLAFWLNVWAIALYAAAVAVGSRFGATGVAAALFWATALGLVPVGAWLRWRLTGIGLGEFLRALLPAFCATAVALLMAKSALAAGLAGPGFAVALRLALAGLLGGLAYLLTLALLFRRPVAEMLATVGLRLPYFTLDRPAP